MSDEISIRDSEVIPLYLVLHEVEESLNPALHGLLSRIERRLFEALSIEEIEALSSMGDVAVEALSKKL